MGQTVNLLVYTFGGSNPSSPTSSENFQPYGSWPGGCIKCGVFVQAESNGNLFTLPRRSQKTRKKFEEFFAEVAQLVEH